MGLYNVYSNSSVCVSVSFEEAMVISSGSLTDSTVASFLEPVVLHEGSTCSISIVSALPAFSRSPDEVLVLASEKGISAT